MSASYNGGRPVSWPARKPLPTDTRPPYYPADEQPPLIPDEFGSHVKAVTLGVASMLISKNAQYGNSALEPSRIFSRSSPREQIFVRIDDKLSRIKAQHPDDQEDTILDLIGYLVLLKVQERMHGSTT